MSADMIERAAAAPAVAISYGSIAWWLGKKPGTEHSHKWTLFVRGAHNQDITHAVAKVVFTLHASFADSVREVTAPPFQVSETGWGVFEAGITIHLRDPSAPPIVLKHMLKLFADSGAQSVDKPVLSEFADEIVFNTLPDDAKARAALLKGPGRDPPPYPYAEHLTVWASAQEQLSLQAAREWVAQRRAELQERLTRAQAEREGLTRTLGELGIGP